MYPANGRASNDFKFMAHDRAANIFVPSLATGKNYPKQLFGYFFVKISCSKQKIFLLLRPQNKEYHVCSCKNSGSAVQGY